MSMTTNQNNFDQKTYLLTNNLEKHKKVTAS